MARLLGLGSGHNRVVENFHQLCISASSNTGNLMFNFAIEQLIQLKETGLRWNTPPKQLNSYNEPVVVPMANNIGRHMDLEKSGPNLKDLSVPYVVLGLGAQFRVDGTVNESVKAIPEGTIRWLNEVCASSAQPNISVRGDYTYQIFKALGLADNVVKLGCPSHFISANRSLGNQLSAKCDQLSVKGFKNGIGVTAGNPDIKNLFKLERFLLTLIDQHGGIYAVQNPKALICIAEGWTTELQTDEIENVRSGFFPELSQDEMKSWMMRFARTYISVPQWFSDIRKKDFVIGTRIHGCQVALQAGVPTVCLYIDSRTKELCDTMHVPCIKAQEFQNNPSVETIIETLKGWDWKRYDENRMALCRETLSFIESNGLKASRHFKQLVENN